MPRLRNYGFKARHHRGSAFPLYKYNASKPENVAVIKIFLIGDLAVYIQIKLLL